MTTVTRNPATDLTAAHARMRAAAAVLDSAEFMAAEQDAIRARSADLPAGTEHVSAGIMPVTEAAEAYAAVQNLAAWAAKAAESLPDTWRSPGGADAAYVLEVIADIAAEVLREYRAAIDLPGRMGRVAAAVRANQHASDARRMSDYLTGGRVYA